MIDVAVFGLLILAFVLIEGFFAGGEMALISANRPRILRLAKENDLSASIARSLLSRPELLFSTTVAGTTLASVAASAIATLWGLQHNDYAPELVIPLALSPIIVVFGEFIPKMIGRANADRIALLVAKPLVMASFVMYPFTRLLTLYADGLKRLLGASPRKGFFLTREEIQAAVPASRGSDVTASERVLIQRILDFGNRSARDMLRPLIDVVAIEESQSIEEAVRLFSESELSRMPVYQQRIDMIVGVIQGFDCLGATDLSQPVKTLMKPAFFIPESKPVDELLIELRARPMAIAVNEFGGAEGIVTLEDVIEEIVGEIEDEYDEPPKLYHAISENSFIVNARMEIDDLREQLRLPIPRGDDYTTLGGFLLKRMQAIPRKWDSIVIDGVEYIVQSATNRSIEEVYVIVHPNAGK